MTLDSGVVGGREWFGMGPRCHNHTHANLKNTLTDKMVSQDQAVTGPLDLNRLDRVSNYSMPELTE